MIEFLTNNWQFVAACVVGILEFIFVLIFKRRPKIVVSGLLFELACLIEEAEAKYKDGIDKIHYVLENAKALCGDAYDETQIRNIVEWLLTLPEKKGSTLNEK